MILPCFKREHLKYFQKKQLSMEEISFVCIPQIALLLCTYLLYKPYSCCLILQFEIRIAISPRWNGCHLLNGEAACYEREKAPPPTPSTEKAWKFDIKWSIMKLRVEEKREEEELTSVIRLFEDICNLSRNTFSIIKITNEMFLISTNLNLQICFNTCIFSSNFICTYCYAS